MLPGCTPAVTAPWYPVGRMSERRARSYSISARGDTANLQLLHSLLAIREFQKVEIGVRNHDVFRLASNPSAHIYIAVRSSRACWVYVQTYSSLPFFT